MFEGTNAPSKQKSTEKYEHAPLSSAFSHQCFCFRSAKETLVVACKASVFCIRYFWNYLYLHSGKRKFSGTFYSRGCRNRLIKSIYLQKCTVHNKLRTVHFFFVQYYVFSIFQTRILLCDYDFSFRIQKRCNTGSKSGVPTKVVNPSLLIYKNLTNSFIFKPTSVSKCNFKSFFFLCHVYSSFLKR